MYKFLALCYLEWSVKNDELLFTVCKVFPDLACPADELLWDGVCVSRRVGPHLYSGSPTSSSVLVSQAACVQDGPCPFSPSPRVHPHIVPYTRMLRCLFPLLETSQSCCTSPCLLCVQHSPRAEIALCIQIHDWVILN